MLSANPKRRRHGYGLALLLFGLAHWGAVDAAITVDVNPQTTTVGTPVTVFGSSNCEVVILDFGDGSPNTFIGMPGPYSTTHVYTAPSPNPPGVWLITATGSNCATPPSVANISVIVNPGAGGAPGPTSGLAIQRLALYFDNHRAETRVAQHAKGLRAYAQIHYTGTGLLQGFWEVDGRVWAYVNQHLVFGKVVTFASPAVPGFPTLDPGVHRVRLVLTRPSVSFAPPLALYFVGVDEAKIIEALRLVKPVRRERLDYDGYTFEWSGLPKVANYQVAYFDAEGEQPIFSAFTKSARYQLPEPVVNDRFVPGRDYHWRVTAYDARGEVAGRSPREGFAFAPLDDYVPRQVVVATDFSLQGAQTLARLKARYVLKEVHGFRLRSLDWQVTVLETREDVEALARTLANEDGVRSAQPNFLLRTFGEPQAKLQTLHALLNFDVLHRHARGRNVRVAVIDTGVEVGHPDLKDRVVLYRNLVRDGRDVAEIHGTAVAGVIAASRNGAGIAGIAPEAQLLALRACRQIKPDHPRAQCAAADVAQALDVALTEKARVVNMSFGSAAPAPLIARLVENGARSGTWFVAPVGNAAWQRQVAFPASHRDVIAVGGSDESGRPYPNEPLYRRSRVIAPATHVFSTVPGARHNFLNGTSLASAVATGLIALALERHSLTPAELPARDADLCVWTERLLKLSLCVPASPGATADPDRDRFVSNLAPARRHSLSAPDAGNIFNVVEE